MSAYRRYKKRVLQVAAKDPDFQYTRRGRIVFVSFKDLVGNMFCAMAKAMRKWREFDWLYPSSSVPWVETMVTHDRHP